MPTTHSTKLLGLVFLGALLGAACGPTYPDCDTNEQCKEHKEFCVNKKCQQCRDARDCAEGQSCSAGKCVAIAGYCRDKSQCPAGQECIANRCRACQSDGECPSGLKCRAGACVKAQCTKDDDCPQDQECKNGFCEKATKTAPTCKLDTVYFDFDKAVLSPEATSTLGNNANQIKGDQRTINLVGRADARGTPEYNMALSDRRAQAVKEHLQRLGIAANRLVPVPRGELDATGDGDAGWAKDRRVDSECQ